MTWMRTFTDVCYFALTQLDMEPDLPGERAESQTGATSVGKDPSCSQLEKSGTTLQTQLLNPFLILQKPPLNTSQTHCCAFCNIAWTLWMGECLGVFKDSFSFFHFPTFALI